MKLTKGQPILSKICNVFDHLTSRTDNIGKTRLTSSNPRVTSSNPSVASSNQ